MQVVFSAFLFVVGAILGSFLCCQARRLRRRELKQKKLPARSVCFHCGYRLKWYDNLPLISWLVLRGKCRKCKREIGVAEVLSEWFLSLSFLAISGTINAENATLLEWAIFAITLLLTLSLAFLAIYDGAYGELPSLCLTFSAICAIILVTLRQWAGFFNIENPALDAVISAAIFGGIYLVLYLVSKGKWVGDGDWILAAIVGAGLSSPWLTLLALFLSNLAATIVAAPSLKKTRQIHFGPFLVFAFVILTAFSDFFLRLLP